MDQNALIMTIVFAVGFVMIFIADTLKFYTLRATLQPLLDVAFPSADRALAAYGARLHPAHEVFAAAATLLDQDTDTLVQALPPEAITLLRELLATAQTLTDGEVESAP